MRGADASAGTIKSGGATRRAAKMVVLDVDHPDIEEFIDTKAREEDKIRALRDAGFDMDLGGKDIVSVQYQNANNSVRVSDEFMRAVEEGASFGLRGRMDGRVMREVDARELFDKIAKAAWECADPGIQYDDTINDWHTNPETGRITASNPCSEYMSLDNSSCNLASLNLLKFLRDDDTFDAVTFQKVVELVITAMDISICFADFPTESIGVTTRDYRQLGIGYANLGALLMATGHGYDSDGGRALAAAITSLLTGAAYKRSAELAGVVGPYAGYARNADGPPAGHAQAPGGQRRGAHLRRDGPEIHDARPRHGTRSSSWARQRLPQRAGLRARPDRHHRLHDGLRHDRHRAGLLAGQVQEARRRRVDADRQPHHPAGAGQAGLPAGVDRGDRRIHRRQGSRHRRPGPQARALRGLRLRDGCTGDLADGSRADDGGLPAVPLRRDLQDGQPARDGHGRGDRRRLPAGLEARPQGVGGLPRQLQGRSAAVRRQGREGAELPRPGAPRRLRRVLKVVERVEYRPVRKRLPKRRPSQTISFSVGGAEGYLTAGSYPDDGLGEIFIKLGKQGSTLAGVMDSFALAISIALQYGVPLETFVEKFTNLRFEPAGPTDDPDMRMATSIMDYVFRRLALDYLDFDTRSFMGIHTAQERARHLETGSYAAPEATDGEIADELESSAQSLVTHCAAPGRQAARRGACRGWGCGRPSEGQVAGPRRARSSPVPGRRRPVRSAATIHSSQDLLAKFQGKAADAPMCMTCGTKMRPAGSCYVCEGCGSTSGCS
jgi:ribonucleoside-diphosphate reductase alpha chain